jgi:hypothetical protein
LPGPGSASGDVQLAPAIRRTTCVRLRKELGVELSRRVHHRLDYADGGRGGLAKREGEEATLGARDGRPAQAAIW